MTGRTPKPRPRHLAHDTSSFIRTGNVTDADEHLLLRSTAGEVFASNPSPGDIASLGWLGLLTSEDFGGEGWFPVEATLIAMQGGQLGTSSTWFMSALAAAWVSQAPETSAWTSPLLSGELVGSYASAPELTAAAGSVSGTVDRLLSQTPPGIVVLDGPEAIGCVAVFLGQNGARVDPVETALETERQLFSLALNGVQSHRIQGGSQPTLALLAMVLLCADTVGAVGRAVQIVTEYLAEREAFDVPIASFQVVQHRLVNLATIQSASEALVLRAAASLAEGEHKAERLALAAHAFIEGRAVQAIDDCIQLAGGIGFTWEFPLHHALRRASTNASLLGSGRSSRRRLAVAEGRSR
jgi:Acyl-CoA dehydrogenase, C-terminal domain